MLNFTTHSAYRTAPHTRNLLCRSNFAAIISAIPSNPASTTTTTASIQHNHVLQQRSRFSTTRTEQTTAAQQVRTRYANVPPYPHGPRLWYKKSNFGLFGTARVRFGNKVSEQNEHKTRRRWYPNVQRKRLWSVALGRFIRVKVVTRVLRSIDKAGGIDEYLLGEKTARIRELGPGGWALRWRVMRTDAVRERYRSQRAELGLPELTAAEQFGVAAASPLASIGGADAQVAQVLEEDVGLSEEQLMEREAAIDRALDEDEQRDAKGLDGGVELEDLAEQAEVKEQPNPGPRPGKKW